MDRIYIVIPTYNELNNISLLLDDIFALGIAGLNVLVVDDNSPDGTARQVENMKGKYSNLHLLVRQRKEGLGPAYVAGFTEALERGADYIFEMDADFSHDPAHLKEFLLRIKDADLVLGSRYVKGGSIKNWNILRRLVSSFGNLYARALLGLPYRDLTGGFKCYRAQLLRAMNLNSLSSVGYNFQIETTYIAHQNGARIVEIPITFTERREGNSKFNFKILLESFWKVLMLRLEK